MAFLLHQTVITCNCLLQETYRLLTNCTICVFLYFFAVMSSNAITIHHNSQHYSVSLCYLINVLDCYLKLHLCIISQAFLEVGYLNSKAHLILFSSPAQHPPPWYIVNILIDQSIQEHVRMDVLPMRECEMIISQFVESG